VLYLSSFESGAPTTEKFTNSFRQALSARGYSAQIYLENLDSLRVPPSPRAKELFLELLVERYKNLPVELILAQSSQTVDLAIRLRDQSFKDKPVLCFDQIDPEIRSRWADAPNVYGRNLIPPFQPTMRLARALFPKTRKALLLVTGASPATIANYVNTIDALREEMKGISFQPLYNQDWGAVEKALELAGQGTVVLMLPGGWNGPDGRFMYGADFTASLSHRFSLPVFSMSEQNFGAGLVGGSLVDYEAMGKTIADTALQIIQDTPKPIPWLMVQCSRDTVDYRSLARFGLSKAMVPAAAELRFSPLPFWQRYEGEIKISILILIVLIIILVLVAVYRWRENGFLRQNYRDKQVEAEGIAVQNRLLATMNHEVNTPLGNAILASSLLSGEAVAEGSLGEVLGKALDDIKRIVDDRSIFWDFEPKYMARDEFTSLLDRMVRRSMSGLFATVTYDFHGELSIPYSNDYLRICLYSIDLLGHQGQEASFRKRFLVSLSRANGKGNRPQLDIMDNARSILPPQFDELRPELHHGQRELPDPDLWPKVLYLERLSKNSLGGELVIRRTKEGFNLFSFTFSQ
jgi:signal transduction histidine kinase